jgi:hypothetical protein
MGKRIPSNAHRIFQEELKMACQQQNVKQPGAVQVGEMFLLKSEEKRAVGTFLQKSVCGPHVRLFQGSSANHGLEMFNPFITSGKKMFEAEI